MNIRDLTVAQLQRAISIKEEIEGLEARLANLTGGESAAVASPVLGRKHKMSRAGRAAIAAGVKARWARIRAEKEGLPTRKRRKMSPAAKAKIAAAAKARWAAVRAAGKTRL